MSYTSDYLIGVLDAKIQEYERLRKGVIELRENIEWFNKQLDKATRRELPKKEKL